MTGFALFFEDFTPGEETVHGTVEVSAEDIVAFAQDWDPQPMHLTEEGGRNSLLGGLAASGWQTCCILMRMMCDAFLLDTAAMGSPGVEEVRWLRPVRPGDLLSAKRTVLEARVSASRPKIGILRLRYEVTNQRGEAVMTMVLPVMIARREVA